MENNFRVRILEFSNIREIEGVWTADGFAALLDAMEFGDQSGMSDGEMREMCLMSLQDQGPERAAYLVLKHELGGVLRDGQLQHMSNEMLDEKLWEEYVDPALHERLFNVGSLLFAAFPRTFPEPDAVRVRLEVASGNAVSRELFVPSPDVSFLVRLLADGMDSHAVLHRLYGEQLKGKSFPNADEVVWIVRTQALGEDLMALEVIGSGYWLDGLAETQSYESAAYADEIRTPRAV